MKNIVKAIGVVMLMHASMSAQQTTIRQRHPITNLNIALATTLTGLVLVTTPPVYGAEPDAIVQQGHEEIQKINTLYNAKEQTGQETQNLTDVQRECTPLLFHGTNGNSCCFMVGLVAACFCMCCPEKK